MPPKKRGRFDSTRFLSAECEEWFNSREHYPFLVECTVEASTIETLHLDTLWGQIGWKRILTDLGTPYSPDLVKEFYANLKGRDKKREERQQDRLESWVRGKWLIITREDINNHFGIVEKNATMYFSVNDFRVVKQNYHLPDYDTFAERLGSKVSFVLSSKGKKPEPFVNRDFLLPDTFLSTEVMCRNVFPKKTNIKRLRIYDSFILSGMVHRDEVDWYDYGRCVLEGIWNAAMHNVPSKGLAFPILITQLLRGNGVELVQPVDPEPDCVVSIAATFRKYKQFYYCMNQTWYNMAREILHERWNVEQKLPCTAEEFVPPTKAQLRRLGIERIFKDEEESEEAG